MSLIPDSHKDLLEGPVVVALVTMMPDGQPQATPVWCLYDGENIIVNTAEGRQKDRNMKANPKVSVLAIDPQNPYRFIEVRGTISSYETVGAEAVIDQMAKLYRGVDHYYGGVAPAELRERETRITFIITPERVVAH